jgi:signal recognition particle subunit SRP14
MPQVSTDSPQLDTNLDTPLPLLIRATNGKAKTKREDKIKLSTVVAPDALDAFYARYVEVCKAGMASLKPRDRTKRKAKAKKKKGGSS